jgi:hypothetical protein
MWEYSIYRLSSCLCVNVILRPGRYVNIAVGTKWQCLILLVPNGTLMVPNGTNLTVGTKWQCLILLCSLTPYISFAIKHAKINHFNTKLL